LIYHLRYARVLSQGDGNVPSGLSMQDDRVGRVTELTYNVACRRVIAYLLVFYYARPKPHIGNAYAVLGHSGKPVLDNTAAST
jgi:hypothetical protein